MRRRGPVPLGGRLDANRLANTRSAGPEQQRMTPPARYRGAVNSASSPRPTASARLKAETASVIPTVPGLPFWGAVLVALVATAVAALIDLKSSHVANPTFSAILSVGFLLGVVLASLAVRRRAVFTAMVQPPLVLVVVVFLVRRAVLSERIPFTGLSIISLFPLMAIGTAVAVVIGAVRLLIQPLRRRRTSPPNRQTAGAHF